MIISFNSTAGQTAIPHGMAELSRVYTIHYIYIYKYTINIRIRVYVIYKYWNQSTYIYAIHHINAPTILVTEYIQYITPGNAAFHALTFTSTAIYPVQSSHIFVNKNAQPTTQSEVEPNHRKYHNYSVILRRSYVIHRVGGTYL